LSEQKFESLQALVPDVSRETFQRLIQFEGLFLKWNASINLAAPSTLTHLWTRHILDSAQLPTVRSLKGKWLDLGSGGGFPGAVLATLAGQNRDANIHLVESSGKKAAFLRTVIAQTQASGEVHVMRVESAQKHIAAVDVVTARALAPLNSLIGLAFPWLSVGAVGLFHKGRDYSKEIDLARDAWTFDLIEHPSKIDADSVILEISNVSHRLRDQVRQPD
jgi:16S rRNA (guanine527-N7)-methyltransferase